MADSLFDPYDLAITMDVNVESWNDQAYEASGDVVRVYGRADPVVVTDVRTMPAGTLVILTLDLVEKAWMDALLATGRIIGFHPSSPAFGIPDPIYLYVAKVTCSRVVKRADAPERRWTMEVQQTATPVVA